MMILQMSIGVLHQSDCCIREFLAFFFLAPAVHFRCFFLKNITISLLRVTVLCVLAAPC